MTSDELTDLAWNRLRSEPTRTSAELGIPSFPLPVTTSAGKVRLALGAGELARLLIPIASGEQFPKISEARGILLSDSVFMVGGRPRRFIDLSCKARELEEVFRDVVVEILRRIGKKELPAQAVEGSIKDYRDLLLGVRTQDISSESAVGILGELVLLDRILSIDSEAWTAWTGPLKGRHDFRAGLHAVEVKATLRSHRKTIQISALDQLAEPPGGTLTLYHQVFEEDAGGDLNVPVVAARILARCSDPEAVTELFSGAGYDPQLSTQWEPFRFSILFSDAYKIVPGFPRLVPSDFESSELPPGVSHFRYAVDLSAASKFSLRDDEFDTKLKELISCLDQS